MAREATWHAPASVVLFFVSLSFPHDAIPTIPITMPHLPLCPRVQIGVARGGKEGNTAFVDWSEQDVYSTPDTYKQQSVANGAMTTGDFTLVTSSQACWVVGGCWGLVVSSCSPCHAAEPELQDADIPS